MRKRIITALLITIITVSGCGNNDKEENVITSSSTLTITQHSERASYAPEPSVAHETTSNLFTVAKEYVYIDHNDKSFNFMVQEGVHKKSFENSRLEKDNIYKYYDPEKCEVISHWGIDVSVYQGTIDWEKVSECGVEFAIIRLGYRGYGKEGRLVLDKEFENNIKGAIQSGIQVGVYFFTQALSEEEAKFVLDTIKQYNITYPVIIDTEEIDPKYDPRTINITSCTGKIDGIQGPVDLNVYIEH